MVRDKPLHNFLFETELEGFYRQLDCFCTPWIDTCVLLHLVRFHRPARFLEIGTHRGFTTRTLAARFPEMSIVTVDPGDSVPAGERPPNQVGEFLPHEQVGELVTGLANVRVIKKRFRDVAWDGERFEMIFIDGDHTLAEVLADSHLALRLVTSPGVVVWHDYNNVPDVNLALEQLHLSGDVVWLHNTWMAYYDTQ
jgi:predicted O-methyltransferase YrrM